MAERKTLFVDIILPIPIRKEFTYRVPYELNDIIFTGARVVVPFGRSKLVTGIITSIHENVPQEYQAKYIEHLLDDKPIINPNQYTFWKWISNYYMAPIGDVMNAALPANFKLASETKIVLHPDYQIEPKYLTEKEHDIVLALDMREVLDLKEIYELIGIKTIQPIIKSLIDKRAVLSKEELNEKFSPKTAVHVRLSDAYCSNDELNEFIKSIDGVKSKEKQLNALLQLLQCMDLNSNTKDYVLRKKLINADVSLSSLNTLERNGIITQEKIVIYRFDDNRHEGHEFKELSEAQKIALSEVQKGLNQDKVTLLHGVTGSGKTEIYVQLIQEQLDLGKQVLFLLPEIALTTQLIQRLSTYFGEQIGVYH